MEIFVKKGKLSEEKTDAYVLAFNSLHNSPDKERYEVEHAGAKGVGKFVELRLRQQYAKTPLNQGVAIFMDSSGGNAKQIICIVCRNQNKDYALMKASVRSGLFGAFVRAREYSVKRIAMVPLCVSDGLNIKDFVEALKDAMESYKGEHFVEQITIVVPQGDSQEQNFFILQEEFAK